MNRPREIPIVQRAARRGPDWWVYLAAAFLLLQLAFCLIPHLNPGMHGVWMWMIGGDSILWMALASLFLFLGFVWSLVRRPVLNRWRVLGVGLLVLLAFSPMLFRTYPSSYANRPSAVRFRLPLDGPITVAWGGDAIEGNYHVAYPNQRWAYDLLVARDGVTHKNDGKELSDYYCYGLPVLAPTDGVVVQTRNTDPDMPVGELGGGTDPGGNQVVIEVAPGEFLYLCHLKPGSVVVNVGDRVTAGQIVGQVGNSGNTSEPHLHIHLQNNADGDLAEGIPLYFHDYRLNGSVIERGMPTGGVSGDRFSGQVVEHAGPKPGR